jgi:hypothetical protein
MIGGCVGVDDDVVDNYDDDDDDDDDDDVDDVGLVFSLREPN